MASKEVYGFIFVLCLLASFLFVSWGYGRAQRGMASPDTKRALQAIGQWRFTDGWGPNVYYGLAIASIVAGLTVEYWLPFE